MTDQETGGKQLQVGCGMNDQEQIKQGYLALVGDDCTEEELEYFASVIHTDLALKFKPPRLHLLSVRVREGV